ncbi:hypothetical protein HGG75_24910 [Ochrobactrum pseudogrignonense]|nr:hypothetical protein [Brucella pseudogrignonensis]
MGKHFRWGRSDKSRFRPIDLRSANSYSGATAVTGGTLRVGPGASLANSSAISISNGGTLSLTAANALSSNAAVSLTGNGSQLGLAADQQIGSLAGTAGTSIYVDPGVTLTTGTSNTSSIFLAISAAMAREISSSSAAAA